jgi:hypothetical protein
MHKFILECTGNQQLFERLMNLVEKTDGNDAPTLVRLCVGNVGIYVKKELEISPDARVAILEDLREKAPDEFKKLIDLAKKNPRKAVELMPLHSSDRGRFNRELEEASSRAGAPKGET